jgi:integrase
MTTDLAPASAMNASTSSVTRMSSRMSVWSFENQRRRSVASAYTFASHAIMNGAPLFVVARNLGHSTTAMVEKHYGHLAPSYIADAIRAAAPRFGYEEPDQVAPMRGSAGA